MAAKRTDSRRPEGGEEREAGQRVQASHEPGDCTAQAENECRANDNDHGCGTWPNAKPQVAAK